MKKDSYKENYCRIANKGILNCLIIALLLAGITTIFLSCSHVPKTPLKLEDAPTAGLLSQMPETDEIFGWITDLTAMGSRITGTDAGRQASQYVAQKFQEFGLKRVAIEHAETKLWTVNDWELTVAGARVPSYYMAHTYTDGSMGAFTTPADGIKAELVYVGEGKDKDFRKIDVRGKIVVSEVRFNSVPIGLARLKSYLYYDPDHSIPITSSRLDPYSANNYPYNFYHAVKGGAVGFIGILTDYLDRNIYNNEDYSAYGEKMSIPGLWVSKSTGAQLKAAIAQKDSQVMATLKFSGKQVPATGGAVVGYLPGASGETIMIHSHHDSSTPGAVEDASGTAMVLALAKFYANVPLEHRKKTLLFATMDTHFSGYDAHEAFIKNHLHGQDNILADVCLEHIAKEVVEVDGKPVITGQLEPRVIFISNNDALIDITREEVVRHSLKRTVMLPTDIFGDDIPSDADPIYRAGIPVISLISGPIYLYDEIDTSDKVAKEQLRPVAEAFADIVWRLSELPASQFKSK